MSHVHSRFVLTQERNGVTGREWRCGQNGQNQNRCRGLRPVVTHVVLELVPAQSLSPSALDDVRFWEQ
jgi:hypothetical protein